MDRNSESYTKNTEQNELQVVLKAINQIQDLGHKTLLKLILFSGAKTSEVIGLTIHNLQADTLILPGRKVKLPTTILQQLQKQKNYLFVNKRGFALTARTVQKIAKEYSKETDLSPTKLRKIFIKNNPENSGNKRIDTKETISEKQYLRAQTTTKGKEKLLLEILWQTGIKKSELEKINSEKIKQLQLQTETSKKLKELLKKEKQPFTNPNSILKKLGLPTTKAFRNSYIQRKISQGISLSELERQTGIKNLHKFHLYGVLK
jgi:site-specific recombinase XerD